MSIIFLEVDDEITTAISRIRGAEDPHVAVVLPPGSRVATSRINFRILAREAAATGRSLAVIAPDVAVRALAASADLPVFASVTDYQATPLIEPAAPGAGARGGGMREALRGRNGAKNGAKSGTKEGSQAGAQKSGQGGGRDRSREKPPRLPIVEPRSSGARSEGAAPEGGPRGRRAVWIALGAIALIVLAAGGFAAWTLLPGATVTLGLREDPVPPVKLTVRADPTATSVDNVNAIIPAREVGIQLSASNEYQATGTKIDETSATGSVRWSNCDATQAYTIPSGTIVGTSSGVKFATTGAVFLPVAILSGVPPNVKVQCSARDVGAGAVKPGTAGNVNAGTITVIPSSLNSVVISVTNPAATSGGTHTETQVVSQADVDKAVAELKAKMTTDLNAAVADPAQIPAGVRVVPETKALGTIAFTPDPTSLVNQQITSFTLGAGATGTVTGLEEAAVRSLAETRLRANVTGGSELVASSISITLGDAKADGHSITIPVDATARETRPITAEAVRALVRGKTIDEAKTALQPYGTPEISISPAWTSTIPTFDFRLDVVVLPGSSTPGASASPSAGSSGAPASGAGASGSPKASATGSAKP